ncbi:MAG: succinate dehydrogenase/fumarate reductase cytochrome b subunit [Verrucomicrobia bacterium]|nr:MAG: succinate dehydrogenase/fumarate reductase cytochrome b subunit [Verrucomicrobiota bacterium]
MNALNRSLLAYWSSSIGKKWIVALTGLFLVFFLAGHLAGNLVIFLGPEAFNAYAHFLHHMMHGAGIWAFRILMLGAIVAHVVATVALTRQNKAARKPYSYPATIQASRASRTMILTGLTVLGFIIYHLLHFTVRIGNEYNNPELYRFMLDGEEVHNAWKMVIDGFSWWPATLVYVISMSLLCTHLVHGVGSIFQTLGFRSKKASGLIHQFSLAYSVVIWLGFISIPLAIAFGFGR